MRNKTLAVQTAVKLFHVYPRAALAEPNEYMTRAIALLRRGIVLIDEDGNVVQGSIGAHIYEDLREVCGADQDIWDQTFHKSWEKVATAPIEELVFEQLVHYFSTYGMKSLGLQSTPVLPVEEVLPDTSMYPNIKAFTVIRIVGREELNSLVDTYLAKTLAPHKNLVEGIIELMDYANVVDVDNVASFELKVARCDAINIVPHDPVTFLRFLVFKATGSTLLIKDKKTIAALKAAVACSSVDFKNYFFHTDLSRLSSIFYRFKPIFLAFKAAPGCALYINHLRRLAAKNHQPMSDVNVQNVMKLILEHRVAEATEVINKCSGRQLFKLFNYALSERYRLSDDERVLPIYNIRNGKVFVNKECEENTGDIKRKFDATFVMLNLLADALDAKYTGALTGKKYYLPDEIHYAVPISEKQFIGNIPYGTWIRLGDDPITMGVAWDNFKGQQTDFDLHMESLTRTFGWNANWRDSDVLFSGDMTDAPDGAAEVYRFTPHNGDTLDSKEVFLLTISNYTCEPGVPFKFVVCDTPFKSCYGFRYEKPIDLADAKFPPIPLKFDTSNSMTLGLVTGDAFFFYGGELGASNVPKKELYKDFIRSMNNRLECMTQVKSILKNAGAVIYDNAAYDALTEEERAEVIDLSPAALTARTLLDIVDCAD